MAAICLGLNVLNFQKYSAHNLHDVWMFCGWNSVAMVQID